MENIRPIQPAISSPTLPSLQELYMGAVIQIDGGVKLSSITESSAECHWKKHDFFARNPQASAIISSVRKNNPPRILFLQNFQDKAGWGSLHGKIFPEALPQATPPSGFTWLWPVSPSHHKDERVETARYFSSCSLLTNNVFHMISLFPLYIWMHFVLI